LSWQNFDCCLPASISRSDAIIAWPLRLRAIGILLFSIWFCF
jgi:hypothetical protein